MLVLAKHRLSPFFSSFLFTLCINFLQSCSIIREVMNCLILQRELLLNIVGEDVTSFVIMMNLTSQFFSLCSDGWVEIRCLRWRKFLSPKGWREWKSP